MALSLSIRPSVSLLMIGAWATCPRAVSRALHTLRSIIESVLGSLVSSTCLGNVLTAAICPANNISEILTTHPYASLSFEVPSNTSAVILWGNVSPVDGNYSVTLSSPTFNDVQQTASSLTPPANQTFLQPVDSMSPWQGINVIQYLRVINPNTTHTIRVDKLSDGGYAYGLNSVTLISAT